MEEVKTYTAVAERSGDWWAISVPEVRGVFTQTKRLDQVAPTAREAIALILDVAEDDVDVAVETKLPGEIAEGRDRVRALRAELDDAASRYRNELASFTSYLTQQRKLSVRDAAELVGISFQRVSQVLREPPTTPVTVIKSAQARKVAAAARKAVPARKVAQKRVGRAVASGRVVPERAALNSSPKASATAPAKTAKKTTRSKKA